MRLGFHRGLKIKTSLDRVMSGGAVDTTAPTVTITSSESTVTATSPFSVTITFSEEVTGFVVGDITVGNGSAGNFATADNIVYTADITPTATGTVTVDVNASVCTDLAGNANTAATQFSILYVAAKLWLDFSDISTLYQTNDTSTPVTTDGQSIGYVADKSGTGNHGTQATSGNRPTYKASIQNSLSVARCDGGDSLVNASITSVAQPYTFFVVFKVNAIGVRQYMQANNGFAVQARVETNGKLEIYAGTVLSATDPTTNVWQVMVGIYNGASSQIFKNGSAASAVGDAGSGAIDNYRIGLTVTGDIGELLLFAGALSSTVRSAVETYLNNKWLLF